MSDYSPDIKALLDYLHGSLSADLRWAKAIRKIVAERDALAAEVAALKAEVSRISLRWEIADHRVSLLWAERDDARTLFCMNHPLVVSGDNEARDVARRHGWDCFDAKEGQR